MKEQDTTETTNGNGDAMRPIPDGGLQQSMPEWLRRPPAWRNLPKREEPAQAAPPPETSLPEPDTSQIDPRALVDLADLPQWLQDVAARSDQQAAAPEPVTTPSTPVPEAPKEPEMSEQQNRNPVEIGTERSIPFEPVKKGAMDAPEHETKTYGGGVPKSGANPILMGIIALAIVVIIVLIVMAIL